MMWRRKVGGSCRVVKVDKEAAWELFTAQAANEGRTVAAHFGASWCVTSLSMNYKFEELAQTHPDILFLFVDVDDVPVFQAGGEGHAHLLPHQGQGGGQEDRRRQLRRAPQDGRRRRFCCNHSS